MRWFLLLLLMLMVHLATCQDYLYDECIVQGDGRKVEFTTFGASVKFLLAQHPDQDIKIEIKQGSAKTSTVLATMKNMVWMEAHLTLRNAPKLVINNTIHSLASPKSFLDKARNYITIENAYVLLDCPQGLPNRELEPDTAEVDAQILLSGEEESLILIPKSDTKVSMEVEGKRVYLCRSRSSLVVQLDSNKCDKLERDEAVHLIVVHPDREAIVKFLGHDRRELRRIKISKTSLEKLEFLRDDLDGLLNIVQCLDDCDKKGTESSATTGASGTSTGGNDAEADGGKDVPMKVFIAVTVALALLAIILFSIFIHVNIQLRRERRRHQEEEEEEELTSAGLECNSAVSPSPRGGPTTTTTTTTTTSSSSNGNVDTLNDVYESIDDLGLRGTNAQHYKM